jgi:protein-serine/threonine kinase
MAPGTHAVRPTLNDFELLQVIGTGTYGTVVLARKGDDTVYAMKMLSKEKLVQSNQVRNARTERRVLASVSHPFIITMHDAFQTPEYLCFVFDLCVGGELHYHIGKAGRFSEGRSRFYASELVLPIEYLHRLHVIFRDLKPENVLLDEDGHLKLIDFGLSKEGIVDDVSATSLCGTLEYLAPEILKNEGHGKGVDWYSLGALVYEMLTGLPPYYSKDRTELFARIRSSTLKYPPYVSPVSKDFMAQLLQRNPLRRLGHRNDGEEVMEHRWFDAVDWCAVLLKRVVPPKKPKPFTFVDMEQNVDLPAGSALPEQCQTLFESFPTE